MGCDLDMALFMTQPIDENQLELNWRESADANVLVREFCDRSPYSAIHLDFFDGTFVPLSWDDGGGPDDFEIEIGNRVAYSAPLGAVGPLFRELKSNWLPYYCDSLRLSRLSMVRSSLRHDLDHIPFYTSRQLYEQAFDRLYKAFREYLQALFISKSTYPIAYNKWLQEQLDLIGMDDLYEPLLSVLAINDLTSGIEKKADLLKEMDSELDGAT